MYDPIAFIADRLPPEGRCLLMPNGGNLGDALIAAATIQRLEAAGIPWSLLKGQRQSITSKDILVFGGGGSLVSAYEGGVRCVASLLGAGAPVVVLPQSCSGHEEFWQAVDRVTVFCRDHTSLHNMQRFAGVQALLGHDMAIGLEIGNDPFSTAVAIRKAVGAGGTGRVLKAFRLDAEAARAAPSDSFDLSALAHPSMQSAASITAHACSFLAALALHDRVETDRLHVAIGASLLGIPTVLHDNNYGKNRAVYEYSLRQRFPELKFAEGPNISNSQTPADSAVAKQDPIRKVPLFPEYRIGPGLIGPGLISFLSTCPQVLVVHDGCLGELFIPRLAEFTLTPPILMDVRDSDVAAMEATHAETGIVYACFQDDLGLPFVNVAYARRLRVHPVMFANPRDYLSRNTPAKKSLRAEIESQRAAGFLKLDFGYGDFLNLIQAFEVTRNRPGCIVEVGCFCGSSAGALLSYVRSRQAERGFPELSFHYMDVFEGFNYPHAISSSDVFWAGTHQTDGFEPVRERIQAYGRGIDGMRIEVSKCNIITDPIPEEIVRSGVRMANIDVDLYEATAAGLARIAPFVVCGGIMICEDSGHTPLLIGALKALEEFVDSDMGKKFCRLDMPSGQTFLVRVED